MPKKTFYNLPEDKKRRILDAGKREFSKNSIHEASVANIVRDLKIARGTFYKYFEDLEEFYFYLYKKTSIDIHDFLIESITRNNGDLFLGVNDFFEKQVEELFKEDLYSYYKTISLTIDYETNKKLNIYLKENKNESLDNENIMKSFLSAVDFDKYNIKNKDEVIIFAKMITSISHETINEAFNLNKSKLETIETFELKMDWIQNGIQTKGDIK